jgi:AcrR family transcriptional regulator
LIAMTGQAGGGRAAQKQRTRTALLRAARDLLQSGRQPTLLDVADHAGISRATAYRYYSDSEVLLQEAALDGIAAQVERLELGGALGAAPLEARIEETVARIVDMVLANEALFRTYLRGVAAGEGQRGARRLGWLQDALGADRGRFSPGQAERLVCALSLLTGVETIVVAKDVCGLDNAGTRALARWTAQAVLAQALREAE